VAKQVIKMVSYIPTWYYRLHNYDFFTTIETGTLKATDKKYIQAMEEKQRHLQSIDTNPKRTHG